MNALEQQIQALILPSIEAMGYDLVRIRLQEGKQKTLQIMAERTQDHDLNLEDCEKISRSVSAILDVEDPIADEYNLEVSSPGIDRPLVRARDFKAYAGHEIKLTTLDPIDNRKRFRGKLLGIEGDIIQIKQEDINSIFSIELSNVCDAKLVLTDALLKQAASR